MNREEVSEAIKRMPKIELHVHLEGATDAESVWQMAKRNRVRLPAESIDSWKKHYAFRNFEHFIEVYSLSASTMKTPADWEFMAERFVQNQAKQNIVYSEVFLSASHALEKLPADEWMDAIVRGVTKGEQKHGVEVRFIPDIARQQPESQHAVLECVIAAKQTGYIIGLGIGGMEKGYPAKLFADTFLQARDAGLHVLAHAGETTGPATIRDSLEQLHAERIGHGISVLDDPELVQRCRDMKIPFEVCPISNYRLGVVPKGMPHPIRKMLNAGLVCTVNSDDPPMFETSLHQEYMLLFDQGFTWEELVQLNQNAIQSSFLSVEKKEAVQNKLTRVYG